MFFNIYELPRFFVGTGSPRCSLKLSVNLLLNKGQISPKMPIFELVMDFLSVSSVFTVQNVLTVNNEGNLYSKEHLPFPYIVQQNIIFDLSSKNHQCLTKLFFPLHKSRF